MYLDQLLLTQHFLINRIKESNLKGYANKKSIKLVRPVH